jgi:hypothetical protein
VVDRADAAQGSAGSGALVDLPPREVEAFRLGSVVRADDHAGLVSHAQDAAFAASVAWKTFWAENGPQNGSGGFAQLDGSLFAGPPVGRAAVGVRCSAGGITSPVKPQLDGLENGTAFTRGGYGAKKRRP